MSGVKGKSGRKPKSYHRQQTELIIAETSPKAALYLSDVIAQKEKPDSVRIDACKFIINQDIGAPRQRQDIKALTKVIFEVEYKDKPKGVQESD